MNMSLHKKAQRAAKNKVWDGSSHLNTDSTASWAKNIGPAFCTNLDDVEEDKSISWWFHELSFTYFR